MVDPYPSLARRKKTSNSFFKKERLIPGAVETDRY
jgi:hypothetical protein